MPQAVKIVAPGGPEALRLDEITLGELGEGEVLLKQTAIGVNFIDVYHRTGLYKQTSYPAGIGLEGAGVVEKAGRGVALKVGDRVAYCGGPIGSYASHRIIPEKFLIKLPGGISEETGAAIMLKGLTADYLLRRTFRVEKGQTILVHAAAGGVGQIMCQWAKYLNVSVIGTVGNEEKAKLAKKNGCDHTIIYTRESVPEKVREFTKGRGVDVVYDSIGKDTFMASLDCLRKFGMMVSFGNASGPIPPVEPLVLSQKGSLYLTRPSLMHHIEDVEVYRAGAKELFDLVEKNVISVHIGGRYGLKDAPQAHKDLEARKTTGSLILTP